VGHGEVVSERASRGTSFAAIGVACLAVAALAACVRLARPLGYEVAGVSMAPGLLPGDAVATGVFPLLDGLRTPRRFDRWVLAAPDGTDAVKRVVALPGETVSIAAGDLAVDGRVALPPPAVLAERATAIDVAGLERADAATADADTAAGDAVPGGPWAGGWRRIFPAVAPFDDAPFAPLERRVLLPVRDVGLAAVVRIARGTGPVDVRIRVDGLAVRWRFAAPGRHACVAGRLDGHVVGVTWPLADEAAGGGHEGDVAARSGLPPHAPAAWDVVRAVAPTTTVAAGTTVDHAVEPAATLLAIVIEGVPAAAVAEGGPPREGAADAAVVVESLSAWRDLLYRPAADGREEWRLGADEFLLLGDFPSGSRDSRHWGPLARRSLLHRIDAAVGAAIGDAANGGAANGAANGDAGR